MNNSNSTSDVFLHFPTTHTTFTNVSSLPVSGGSWYQEQQLPLYVAQVTIIFFGILTNIVNIAIFNTVGLNDSVTVSFFCLSVSDLLQLIFFGVIRMLSILQYEHGISSTLVRLQDLAGCFGWLSVYFLDVSMYITVYTTFQKCCCVALPLTFKNAFTARRSFIIVTLIVGGNLAVFLPLLVNIIDKWFFDPSTRNAHLDWIRLNTEVEATVWRWIHRIILTPTSQIVVVLCLAVITIKLKQSVKFRHSGKLDHNEKNDKDNAGKVAEEEATKLGQREYRAIQAVQVIALIFVLSTLPSSVNSWAILLFPELNLPRYRQVVFTLQALIYFGGTINAAVNIFVYLKYNTRYRTAFVKYAKMGLARDGGDGTCLARS